MRGLVALVPVVAACGLFPDVGELVGGTGADASSFDAAPPPDTSVPVDAPGTDTSTVPEAGFDAMTTGCQGQGMYLFCADFDSVTNVSDGWSGMTYSSGMTAGALDKTDFVSGPASFVASMTAPSSSGGNTDWALDELLKLTLPMVIDVDLDVRPDLSGWNGVTNVDVLSLDLGDYNTNDLQITWQIEPAGPGTLVYAQTSKAGMIGNPTPYSTPAVPLRTWTHVHLRITLGSAPVIDVDYSGVSVVKGASLPAGPRDPVIQLSTGITYMASASAPWKLEIDNVVLRGK